MNGPGCILCAAGAFTFGDKQQDAVDMDTDERLEVVLLSQNNH